MISLKSNGVTNQSVILIQSISGEGLFFIIYSFHFISSIFNINFHQNKENESKMKDINQINKIIKNLKTYN